MLIVCRRTVMFVHVLYDILLDGMHDCASIIV